MKWFEENIENPTMADKNRIVSNSLILMISEALNRAVRMVLVVFSARLLGDSEFGKFAFAMTFPLLFQILADFGVHQLLIREIARRTKDAEKILGNAFSIKMVLAAFTLIVMVVVIILSGKPHDVVVLVLIMCLADILTSFTELFKSVFQAFQRMSWDALSTISSGIINTVLGIAVLTGNGGIKELALTYLATNALNLLYCVLVTQKKFIRIRIQWNSSIIRHLIKEGYPFGISFFFSTLYAYVSTIMLSYMTNDEVVGWYNTAYRLIFVIAFVPQTVMKAVFPALSNYFKKSIVRFTALYQRTFKIMLWFGVSLAVFFTILSKKIILLLYGNEYIQAAGVLEILAWSTALICMTNLMTRTTRAANHQHFTARVVASSAVLNVVLNFLLIPKYRHIGAAWATLLTEANTFAFHIVFVSRVIVKSRILARIPKVAAINAAMAACLVLLKTRSLWMAAATALVVHVAIVVLTRYFSAEELSFFTDLFRSKSRNTVHDIQGRQKKHH